MKVRAGFGMDGNDVRAGLRESIEERVDGRDHQMDVERLVQCAAECLHHGRADREVRHEMAIHHVDVDPVRARFVDRAHFLAELREVGGQDGRGDEGTGQRPIRR